MLAFVFVVLIKVIFRERDVLFVQLMNPTILCGQMDMQAFQLAYVSISPCLFPSVENSLRRQKSFVASHQSELQNFSNQKEVTETYEHKTDCLMHAE